MKTIGVTSIEPWFVLDNVPLIKDLYYFDKLVYTIRNRPSLEKFCNTLPLGKEMFKEKMKEIEQLEAAGLISEYKETHFEIDKKKYGNEQSIQYALKAQELSVSFTTHNRTFEETFIDFLERFREVGQINARVYSLVLNKKGQDSYTPIIRSNYYKFASNELFSSSTVLSVLFKKFPTVDDSIDLEKFIEFKNDPETQLKLSRFKEWVLEISKKNYTEKEIEQKIDYLLQEYAKQLEFHKMKYSLGAIESFVITSLEVLENLVKLNFSKAAKILFDLSKQEITLLEAEQKFTGRELAFINKLNGHDSR
jgi:hypothetical protein